MRISKEMFTKRGGAVGAVLAAALVLAACGGDGGGADGSGGELTGDPLSGSITWWGWTPDATNATHLIAAFNEEFPDIEVTFVSRPIDSYDAVLSPALTSADGPDVFNVAPGSANGGVDVFHYGAIDLTAAVETALGEDWADQLAEIGVYGLTVGDKLVGLSAGAVYSGSIWINQDLFDEHGLTPPTDMASWIEVCTAFEAAGQGCFVQGAGMHAFNMDTFQAIMENIEPGLYRRASLGEASFTEGETGEKFYQGMEIWRSLFDEGIMQRGAIGMMQYPDANNAFLSGQYAMVMMGSWYTQYAVRDSMIHAMEAAGVSNPDPITIVPIDFPDLAGTGITGHMFGDADYGLAVSINSQNQAAAVTFATWLATSQAGQQAVANTLNNIPALRGITPQWENITLVNPAVQESILSAYTEQAASAVEPRFATVSALLNSGYRDTLGAVATGDMSITDALAHLQSIVDNEQ
ncbi:MAG: ABC transporter substrate-binding protein [Promicromonosporaceae bacterium]|nr:ABC transporter substrate-binding protein [Promicromonosporaceae bacterium]